MNSDAILQQLNRLMNNQLLTGAHRNIILAAIQHIRKQDEEINKIRDDVSNWQMPEKESDNDR